MTSSEKQITFEMLFDPKMEPMLADHKVDGMCVIPAALMLDTVLSVVKVDMLEHAVRLRSVSFQQPILVPPDGQHSAEFALKDGVCHIKGEDITHFTCKVDKQPIGAPIYRDLAQLKQDCRMPISHTQVQAWYKTCGIDYGTTYHTIQQLNIGECAAIGLLRIVHDYNNDNHWVCPTTLDGAFQVLGIAVTLMRPQGQGVFFPWYVQSITARRPIQGPVWCRVDFDNTDGDVISGRCALYSPQGEELIVMEGVRLKRAQTSLTPPAGKQANYLQTFNWRPKPLQGSPITPEQGTWLILRDNTAVADRLCEWLHQQGQQVIEVSRGEAFAQMDPEQFVVRPGDPAAYRQLIDAINRPLQGIVHLWNTTAPTTDKPDLAMEAGVYSIAYLIQALAPKQRQVALWLVTTNAQPVADTVVQPVHAAIWGLGRVIQAEHPRYAVRLVDLPADASAWPALHDEMTHTSEDIETAYRHGKRYCPTTEIAQLDRTKTALPVRAEGCYVIIGGYGGIGQAMTHHLAKRGATQFVLVHTSPLSDKKVAFASGLQQQGITVRSACGDVGDMSFISTLLANAQRDFRRINGILHCAGTLRDGLLRSKSTDTIRQVLHPKVRGSWVLSQFASQYQPDFIILFSSISGIYGNFGQSIYAAANTYQDALAQQQGLPWMSLSWGLWGDVGMGAELVEKMRQRNIYAFSTAEGLAAFDEALRAPNPHWLLIKQESNSVKEDNMYYSQPAPTTPAATNPLEQRIVTLLQDTLRTSNVTPDDTFLEIGLDSMLAVEIAAKIGDWGYTLDPALFFDLPTIRALVEYLTANTPLPVHELTPIQEPHPPFARQKASVPEPSYAAVPVHQQTSVRAPSYAAVYQQAPVREPSYVAAPAYQQPPNQQPINEIASRQFTPSDDAYRPDSPSHVWLNRSSSATMPFTKTFDNPPPSHPAAPRKPFLQQRLDNLNAEDYEIRDRGDYFYEPTILSAQGGWITTTEKRLLNFASYSYLDLIGHPYINAKAHEAMALHGTGTHGVRLLAGTTHVHRELEQTIARFKHTDDAVVYSSGYMTNLATIASLVGPGDYVIGDVYNHASIIDGCKISGATFLQFAHNNMRNLEQCLKQAGNAGKLVVADAVFSMDGDVIDLPAISELCKQYDAALMVDEAHSVGVLGRTGRGIEEHFNLPPDTIQIKMGTLSKTIPSAGGYVAGSHDLVFALKNNARGFMFSAAITPAQAAAAKASFEVIQAEPQRVERLNNIVRYYISSLNHLGFDTMQSETAIVPIVCQSDKQAYDLARICQSENLFVQPIIYPAVPRNTPRLRTIVTAAHGEQEIATALDILTRAGRQVKLIH